MDNTATRQWKLKSRPSGVPDQTDFELEEMTVPTLGPDEVLLKVRYLSVDPYMRGRMREQDSFVSFDYAEPWEPGDVIQGQAVAEVVDSRSGTFEAGDVVKGILPWADYTVAHDTWLTPLDPERAPLTTALGVLGDSGHTAYFGFFDVGQPKSGDTVVVSGAAGSVGSVVGQLGKLCGCRVVGTAGSEAKTSWLTDELGFDDAVNYATSDNLRDALDSACPEGIDVYFDNVGGQVTDAAVQLINQHARIVLCGQIAVYNQKGAPMGPRNEWKLIERQARMEGFLLQQFSARRDEANRRLGRWVTEGEIQYEETVTEGLEHAIEALQGLFTGENIGKQLVKVAGVDE